MKVLVLGSKGMVGSAIVRNLQLDNDVQIIESSRNDTNLFSLQETNELISSISPNVVITAAATVGGIIANNLNRTEFILSNLKINMNVIESIVNFQEI